MKKPAHNPASIPFLALLAVTVLVSRRAVTVGAVTCDPSQLIPCVPAFASSSPPSAVCCTKVREQRPCLCAYIKDPRFGQYVSSPNTRKIASTCGVSIPSCGVAIPSP